MSGSKKKKELRKYLRELDVSRRFLDFDIFIKLLPRDYLLVTYNHSKLSITMSSRLFQAPYEVLQEVVENAFIRSTGGNAPRFGKLASEYLRTNRCRELKIPVQTDNNNRDLFLLMQSTVRGNKSLEEVAKTLEISWRDGDLDLTKIPLATSDINGRAIYIDYRLRDRTINPVFLAYVIYHEVAIFASWDYSEFTCNRTYLDEYMFDAPQRGIVLPIFESLGLRLSYSI